MSASDKAAELARLTAALTNSFHRWDMLAKNGGSDPFWPDGMGLNLTRNHIISEKRQIKALLEEGQEEMNLFGIEFPDIYYRETPAEVRENYMVKADEIRKRAAQQLALYEQDPNFLYLLKNHALVFPRGETRATKEAGLNFSISVRLSGYRKYVEADDLVAMRGGFYEPYEKKAPQWAEAAKAMKAFQTTEHDSKNDLSVPVEYSQEEEWADEPEHEESLPHPDPFRKPPLSDRIRNAQAVAESQDPGKKPREEQLSLF